MPPEIQEMYGNTGPYMVVVGAGAFFGISEMAEETLKEIFVGPDCSGRALAFGLQLLAPDRQTVMIVEMATDVIVAAQLAVALEESARLQGHGALFIASMDQARALFRDYAKKEDS